MATYTEIELNQEFDLVSNKFFSLALPGGKFPVRMVATKDPYQTWVHVYNEPYDEPLFSPILVPSHPELGYTMDATDAHFRGLEEKLKNLDPGVIKRWPRTYLRAGGGVSVHDMHSPYAASILRYSEENPERTVPNFRLGELPLPEEEFSQILKSISLTLTLRNGSYTSPNTFFGVYSYTKKRHFEWFRFDTFKPTEIAHLKGFNRGSLGQNIPNVQVQLSDNVIVDYNKAGFPLCISPLDIVSGVIPARFTLIPQTSK